MKIYSKNKPVLIVLHNCVPPDEAATPEAPVVLKRKRTRNLLQTQYSLDMDLDLNDPALTLKPDEFWATNYADKEVTLFDK
jgi:hypothetical protein